MLFAAAGLIGCARTLPQNANAARLYRDLQRLVALSNATGWRIDESEIRDLRDEALMSVCRTTPAVRRALSLWLDQQVAANGGSVKQAYLRAGKKLGAVADLLELTRIRMLHRDAVQNTNKCPFWLEPKETFPGIQIADNRWLLTAGGGGKAIALFQDGKFDFSAGGAGRLGFGRSFGSRFSLLSAIEVGGSGAFPRDKTTDDRGSLVLALDSVAMAMTRFRLVNAYVELEAGYLMRFMEGEPGHQNGMHIGISYAVRADRREWFLPAALFPGVAFSVIYDQTFPKSNQPKIHMLKIGLRAAVDIHY
jgi:hypothetical protein